MDDGRCSQIFQVTSTASAKYSMVRFLKFMRSLIIVTVRVRSKTGKYCFHRCLSVHIPGGYPSDWSQVPSRGNTPARSWWWGGGGVPQPGQETVTLTRSGWGTSPARDGVFPQTGGGVPPPGMGYPQARKGYPPGWGSRWNTWYAAGAMPLVSRQEDCLVIFFIVFTLRC